MNLRILDVIVFNEALPYAHVVTAPYTSLLSKSARESLGIRIKDNVVVVNCLL